MAVVRARTKETKMKGREIYLRVKVRSEASARSLVKTMNEWKLINNVVKAELISIAHCGKGRRIAPCLSLNVLSSSSWLVVGR